MHTIKKKIACNSDDVLPRNNAIKLFSMILNPFFQQKYVQLTTQLQQNIFTSRVLIRTVHNYSVIIVRFFTLFSEYIKCCVTKWKTKLCNDYLPHVVVFTRYL